MITAKIEQPGLISFLNLSHVLIKASEQPVL